MHAKESESMSKSWRKVARKCVKLQETVELRERALGHKKMSMHEKKQAHNKVHMIKGKRGEERQ